MTGSAPLNPVEAARAAGLRYVSDARPGIRREREGDGFAYYDAAGRRITAESVLERIRKLAVPPAWEKVWICPHANGHLQATGRDSKGRKQYRYHAGFRAVRDRTKYDHLAAFARALPRIRARVEADLAKPGLSKERVVATVVKLLELTRIRVGNEEYTRENGTFGLTTLSDEHAEIRRDRLRFRFTGKSGVPHDVTLRSPRLARIVRACQDLPGEELFQFLDEDGEPHPIHSDDVNAYIREAAGEDFTAKDFRTWAGTVHAAAVLGSVHEVGESLSARDRHVVAAVKETARELRNRPATCRKYYVHPAVIEAFRLGALPRALGIEPEAASREPAPCALSVLEEAVLRIIDHAAHDQARAA